MRPQRACVRSDCSHFFVGPRELRSAPPQHVKISSWRRNLLTSTSVRRPQVVPRHSRHHQRPVGKSVESQCCGLFVFAKRHLSKCADNSTVPVCVPACVCMCVSARARMCVLLSKFHICPSSLLLLLDVVLACIQQVTRRILLLRPLARRRLSPFQGRHLARSLLLFYRGNDGGKGGNEASGLAAATAAAAAAAFNFFPHCASSMGG